MGLLHGYLYVQVDILDYYQNIHRFRWIYWTTTRISVCLDGYIGLLLGYLYVQVDILDYYQDIYMLRGIYRTPTRISSCQDGYSGLVQRFIYIFRWIFWTSTKIYLYIQVDTQDSYQDIFMLEWVFGTSTKISICLGGYIGLLLGYSALHITAIMDINCSSLKSMFRNRKLKN